MLTKDQWYKKLRSLVPSWVFEREKNNVAIFKGIAAVLERVSSEYDQHLAETFIDQASEEYVELQGSERAVVRFAGESLSAYRQRVKTIVNKSNLPAIKRMVDAILIRGESTIIEHGDQTGSFLNRENFLNRDIMDYQVLYNAFTIMIDYQIPEATSFYDRGNFLDREFLNGSYTSSDTVFRNIIETVNMNKAYGTVYRLIERANP